MVALPRPPGVVPFRHPVLLGDGAHAAATTLLRTKGHNCRRVFAVDLDCIAYLGGDGRPMTAYLTCDDGEHVVIDHVEQGWGV